MLEFEKIYDKYEKRKLTCEEAAELLHCSERTFRRKKAKYESEGLSGLLDQRFGNEPPNKVPADKVEEIMRLRKDQYYDYTTKHFHEELLSRHVFKHSYSWLNGSLKLNGLSNTGSVKRKKHMRKRELKPCTGMMIHQDASNHIWLPNTTVRHDLVVTMDDATNEIYSGVFFINRLGMKFLY